MYMDRWWNVSVISICIVNNVMTITQRKWNRLPLLARLWARLQHGLTVQYAIYGNLCAPINKIGYDGDRIGTAAALNAVVHDAICFIKEKISSSLWVSLKLSSCHLMIYTTVEHSASGGSACASPWTHIFTSRVRTWSRWPLRKAVSLE